MYTRVGVSKHARGVPSPVRVLLERYTKFRTTAIKLYGVLPPYEN
jgi:hypothetical protein